jgi:hypothetical protein
MIKKSRHASLAQQNDFGVTFLHIFANAKRKAQQSLTLVREECDKYNLVIAPCF